jgi:hypothetical protein
VYLSDWICWSNLFLVGLNQQNQITHTRNRAAPIFKNPIGYEPNIAPTTFKKIKVTSIIKQIVLSINSPYFLSLAKERVRSILARRSAPDSVQPLMLHLLDSDLYSSVSFSSLRRARNRLTSFSASMMVSLFILAFPLNPGCPAGRCANLFFSF